MGVGEGYAELEVSAVGAFKPSASWLAALEVGYRPASAVDMYSFTRVSGQWGAPVEWQAGLGARVHW